MNKIIVEIDFEKITKDLLTKETYTEGATVYNSIEESAKREIKDWIKHSVVSEIRESLNLKEFREEGYTKAYLKQEASRILEEELKGLVAEKVKSWITTNMRWIVEKQAEKNIEEFLVPRLQKMISNLMVVNTEQVDEEMDALKSDYESQIRQMEERQ